MENCNGRVKTQKRHELNSVVKFLIKANICPQEYKKIEKMKMKAKTIIPFNSDAVHCLTIHCLTFLSYINSKEFYVNNQ